MDIQYRNNGAIGALLDEYEKALKELIITIQGISYAQLIEVVDPKTDDKDCKSVSAILAHIIESGFVYVIEIRKWLGEEILYKDNAVLNSIEEYTDALKKMFEFNEKLFQDYPNLVLYEHDSNKKITTRWGQQYDINQLVEHAIMHILRHRRQIEKFKLKMNKNSAGKAI